MGSIGRPAPGVLFFIAMASAFLATEVLTPPIAPDPYGPFGPEGPRMREQLWIVPGADPHVPLRATLFRPAEAIASKSVRRPLVVINHGTDASTKDAVAMPVFYWLSKWFVDRGYAVLIPQRRGHGATGGEFVEGRDRCSSPDHYGAGQAAADDIQGALHYLTAQPFIDPALIIVVGVSSGGWASLALAARNPRGVRLVVNFAGGRGGHAYGTPNAVCAPERLIDAAGAFGREARIPTLWFYASNDSYFGPDLATSMADAWRASGGTAQLWLTPQSDSDGHDLVTGQIGWKIWGADLARALVPVGATASLPEGSR